ncbi:hypothetical protein ACYOEI_33705, partial [Singulisphaera rosea]
AQPTSSKPATTSTTQAITASSRTERFGRSGVVPGSFFRHAARDASTDAWGRPHIPSITTTSVPQFKPRTERSLRSGDAPADVLLAEAMSRFDANLSN